MYVSLKYHQSSVSTVPIEKNYTVPFKSGFFILLIAKSFAVLPKNSV